MDNSCNGNHLFSVFDAVFSDVVGVLDDFSVVPVVPVVPEAGVLLSSVQKARVRSSCFFGGVRFRSASTFMHAS